MRLTGGWGQPLLIPVALGGRVPPPSHPLAPYEGMQKLAEGQKPWELPQQLHLEKNLEL